MRTIRTSRAFSLVELLLVVAIIGVVTAVAAPRYANSVARFRVDAAARRVVRDVTLVQSRARATGSTGTIVFNISSQSYQLPGEPDQKRVSNTYTTLLGETPYLTSLGTANFGGDATIKFNGYGLPDSGGSLTLLSGNASRTLTLDASSGVISIQ